MTYASRFGDVYERRSILPIGFLPSNVIGNWCLSRFDKAIVDGWNPVYYGRYVDDILIVDKIEHNSELQKKVQDGELKKEDIINFFLTSCTRWTGLSQPNCNMSREFAVLRESMPAGAGQTDGKAGDSLGQGEPEFRVNPLCNPIEDNRSKIIVQNEKVKIFYFKHTESDALITCFRNNISKNKSEFRHLPEDEAVFQRDDYSEIYALSSTESLNKFRGVDGISLDKYELSKFLGKYLRIGGLIRDKVESRFEKDLLSIFNTRTIVENYTMWEKVIEILVINERFKSLESFCDRIIEAIESIDDSNDDVKASDTCVADSLFIFLHSCLCRSFPLVWSDERLKTQKRIYERMGDASHHAYDDTDINELIKGYYHTRMIDKSVVPILIDVLNLNMDESGTKINLTVFDNVLSIVAKKKWEPTYKYYPYMLGMYDINIVSCIGELNPSDSKKPFDGLDDISARESRRYLESNYLNNSTDSDRFPHQVSVKTINNAHGLSGASTSSGDRQGVYLVSVGSDKKSSLRVAIASVRLQLANFEKIVKDAPDRSYSRYRDLSQLVNQAIDQKADMLVMPEAYVPFEWLPTLARTCAKNSLSIVTGVEHLNIGDRIYNLTAVILPYVEDTYRCAHISFHLKRHYAPEEKERIESYRLHAIEGGNYELYKWNDCFFAVYCCYELASIADRSLFQSYADVLVAVEWNRDVNYYSNILESLSRDVHCYCVQVNSSEYGDSRITRPSKTVKKDVIRTKGGTNSSILVDELDIGSLRDFQIKGYALQKQDKEYKVTPPNFDKDVVMSKIKGEF